jgi:4-cresol dehydrogenase (hydroxylating) flavoprotein subunit
MDEPEGFPAALREWESILGSAHVIRAADLLQAAGTATFATSARVLGILRPDSRELVQECLRIANRRRVPVYPVSSGKNWGYGSSVPPGDGVLLDLGRMTRIVEFDEELAYVTIEPGVTQRQLHAFLRDRNSGLWMDATGASPDCSIIGNTMERGFGHTPMGDHSSNSCGFEVVLPTGGCIQTGFGQFQGAKTQALNRFGVGPALDGLFTQSNLGIVTKMSVWLMPQPEQFEAFFFLCDRPDTLPAVVDALRPLRMSGTLRSVMHIGNDYKVLAATGQYPWGETKGEVPLRGEVLDRLRKRAGVGYWTGSGGLYGTKAQVRDARRQLRRTLAGKVKRLQFVDDRLIGLMSRFARPFRVATGWDIERTLKVLLPVYNLLKGVPTDSTLGSTYWRKKGPIPAEMDPDRDGCGLLWCSPVVPNTGSHVAAVTQLATRLLLEHGFEPQMSLSLASERTVVCVITISYDRDVAGEDDRALSCYRELSRQVIEAGYPPYRLSVVSTDLNAAGELGNVVRAIKQSLDPNGILAPRRYARAPVAHEDHVRAVAQR